MGISIGGSIGPVSARWRIGGRRRSTSSPDLTFGEFIGIGAAIAFVLSVGILGDLVVGAFGGDTTNFWLVGVVGLVLTVAIVAAVGWVLWRASAHLVGLRRWHAVEYDDEDDYDLGHVAGFALVIVLGLGFVWTFWVYLLILAAILFGVAWVMAGRRLDRD